MLEFKVCIPDDKTEQILHLFEELNISYTPILPQELDKETIKVIEERFGNEKYEPFEDQGTFTLFLHHDMRDEMVDLDHEMMKSLQKLFTVLQKFPLNYPMAFKQFKVAELDFGNIYYFVREDLNACYLIMLDKKKA